MTWCFRQANVPGYHGLKNLRSKKAPQVSSNLTRKCGPLVIHGEQDAFDCQRWIQATSDAHQCIEQFRYAFQCEIFALNRNQNSIAGDECIQRQQIESRGTIDQHEVVSVFYGFNSSFETKFPLLYIHEFNCSSY